MKKSILILVALLLLSCVETEKNPKQVFIDFFINLKMLNFQKAESFLNDNSKKDFELIKNEFQKSSIFTDEIEKVKSIKDEDIIKEYNLDSLIEVISGTNAVIMTKDTLIKIS